MTRFVASARASGPRSAVAWMKLSTGVYDCGPSSGMISGSSGASLARRSARSTVRRSAASSNTFDDTEARRFAVVLTTLSVVSVIPPDVVISPPAKRVLPLQSLAMTTRVSSAFANDSTLSVSAFACSRERSGGAELPKSERGASPNEETR